MDNSSRGRRRGSEKGKREGCRGKCRAPKGDGSETRRRKIYNFARHSAYKMSQQTTVGAAPAAAAMAARGRRVGGSGEAGQAVKRQPPPTTIRKQTNPATTTPTTTRMYTSLSLCLLRATCASDVAMICIEVWHKKQNTRCQPGKGQPGSSRRSQAGCGAELCVACFYDTYATLWFGPQVTRAGGGGGRPLPTYIHTHTYASEYHNKQRDSVGAER